MATKYIVDPSQYGLTPKQLDCFFRKERYGYIIGSTKSGKTVTAIYWLLDRCARIPYEPGRTYEVAWVAPNYDLCQMVFERILAMNLDIVEDSTKGDLAIWLKSFAEGCAGAKIVFKSFNEEKEKVSRNSVYGNEYWAVAIDEASRLPESAIDTLSTTITPTGGFVRAFGNVNGDTNWHWRNYQAAKRGDLINAYAAELSAQDSIDAGIYLPEELDEARSRMSEEQFMQMYFNVPCKQQIVSIISSHHRASFENNKPAILAEIQTNDSDLYIAWDGGGSQNATACVFLLRNSKNNRVTAVKEFACTENRERLNMYSMAADYYRQNFAPMHIKHYGDQTLKADIMTICAEFGNDTTDCDFLDSLREPSQRLSPATQKKYTQIYHNRKTVRLANTQSVLRAMLPDSMPQFLVDAKECPKLTDGLFFGKWQYEARVSKTPNEYGEFITEVDASKLLQNHPIVDICDALSYGLLQLFPQHSFVVANDVKFKYERLR